MGNFQLIVRNIYVFTNLEVRLKSRTTKEEANKEVERIIDKKKLFENYDWKIEGCEHGGINILDDKLADDIIERLEQDETDENIRWQRNYREAREPRRVAQRYEYDTSRRPAWLCHTAGYATANACRLIRPRPAGTGCGR